jgi:hypothetical protein
MSGKAPNWAWRLANSCADAVSDVVSGGGVEPMLLLSLLLLLLM